MASSNEEVKFNYDNIHPVDFRLLDEQVDIKSIRIICCKFGLHA